MIVPSSVKARRRQPAPASQPDIPAEAAVEAGADPPAVGFGQRLIDQRQFQSLSIPLVPLELIVPTPDNPRIIRHDAAMESLIASIRAAGVLEPVLVRVHPTRPGMYDLRSGERRYRAARAAGLAEIPCRVLELDDAEAMSITVIENLEREDLHPLEEARGIQTLLEKGWDEESIASRLGKSAKWVARRARLTKLIEPFKKAALDPEHELSEAPTGLLEDLARLPVDIQQQIQAECKRLQTNLPWYMCDGRSFNRHINETYLRVLDKAPFKLDDALLYPEAGACDRCQKQSGCQPLLFGDEEDEKGKRAGDRCLDAACFHEKCRRVLKEKIKSTAEEQGKAPILIDAGAHDYAKPSDRVQKAFGGAVQTMGRFEETRKTDPKAVAAIVVNGPGIGQRKWVVPRPAAPSRSRSKKADQPVKTDDEKRAEREARRQLLVVEAFRTHLHKLSTGAESLAEWPPLGTLLAHLDAFGTWKNEASYWPGEKLTKSSPWAILKATFAKQVGTGELCIRLWRELFHVWEDRLDVYRGHAKGYYAEIERMNKLVVLDLVKLQAEAEKMVPEPRASGEAKARPAAKMARKSGRKGRAGS